MPIDELGEASFGALLRVFAQKLKVSHKFNHHRHRGPESDKEFRETRRVVTAAISTGMLSFLLTREKNWRIIQSLGSRRKCMIRLILLAIVLVGPGEGEMGPRS